jgi:hypothetical protein
MWSRRDRCFPLSIASDANWIALSLAKLFAVRNPINPRLKQFKFGISVSPPQITTIFGFFGSAIGCSWWSGTNRT